MTLRGTDVPSMMTRVATALTRGQRDGGDSVVVLSEDQGDTLGIGALRKPAQIELEFPSGSARPVVGPVVRMAKRAVRRGLRWYVAPMMEQQSRFNAATLDLVQRLHLADERLGGALDGLKRDHSRLLDRLRADVEELNARAARAGAGGGHEPELLPSAQRTLQYRAFEDRHRGPYADIRELLSVYLPVFRGCRRVVDLGCGRGEFLRLLQEEGIEAYGVDSDESMVEAARQQGLEVVLDDAVSHLLGTDDGAVDGVFSSQVVEHLRTDQVMSLLDAAHRKLAPGGVIAVETPNPEALFIFAAFFYVDLTHIKPLHPEALRWALEVSGFVDVDIRRILPVPDGARLDPVPDELASDPGWSTMAVNVERLNNLLYGPQHFAAVARKPVLEG